MSHKPPDAVEALQALAAGDGPGGGAARALTAFSTAVVAASGVHPYVKLALVGIAITLEFIQLWNGRKRIAQCKLIEGVPEEGGLAYQQHVSRCSYQPYTFTFSHPTDTITGIACVPVDKQTQSPEAEVIEGGINYSHVTIRLTPVDEGNWQCNVDICTKPSSARPDIEADSTRAAAPPADSTRAAAPPADSTRAAAPPAETTCAAAPPADSTRAAAPPVETTCAAAPPTDSTRAAAPPAETTCAAAPPVDTTRSTASPAEITRPVGPAPAVPAGTPAATPALIPQWAVVLVVVLMMIMFIMIMIMMIVIIIRG